MQPSEISDILNRELRKAEAIKEICSENLALRREVHALRVELRKEPVQQAKASEAPEPQIPANAGVSGTLLAQTAPVATGKVEVFIVHPDDNSLFTPEQWKERAEKDGFDPTKAEYVAIRNEFGQTFSMHKKQITLNGNPEMKFQEALDCAKTFVDDGRTGTRKEWIDVYEAIHTAGLNDALELIGGDKITGEWYWTQEKDSDKSTPTCAWVFDGSYGGLVSGTRLSANYARVFRAF